MNRLVRILLVLVALVLVALVIGPFLIPVPPLENTLPVEQLADPDSLFVEVNGLQVHYKTAGQGETGMVLLHGFAASTYSWDQVLEPLARDRTVIAFDRPAFGLTERPLEWDTENPYAPENQVALTLSMMDLMDVENAVLVGNSAGGTIAIATALEHPERVIALVLVDPAVYINNSFPAWLRPVYQTPQARRLGPLFMRSIQNWGQEFLNRAWHEPELIPEGAWESYSRPLQAENWDRALWEMFVANQPLNIPERLDQLQMPVLVITGDDDRIVPTAQSVRLAGEIPGAQLVVIPNCGHVPQEECPQAFLEAVETFLAELPW